MARPERDADRDLPPARGSSGGEHRGHVPAGDEKHAERGRAQEQERWAEGGGHLLVQAHEPHPQPAILPMGGRQARRDHVHLVLGLGERDAGTQPCDAAEPQGPPLLPLVRARLQWEPQVHAALGELEVLGQDPNHDVGDGVQQQRAAEDRGIAAEAAHPQAMTQDRDRGPLVLGTEAPTDGGSGAHHLEEVRGDARGPELRGLAGPGERRGHEREPGQRLERPAVRPPVEKSREEV